MIRCPRCESYDVHRSRLRSGLERVLALGGLLPRRCSACGWRGLRFGESAGRGNSDTAPDVRDRAARLERETAQSRRRRRQSRNHRAKGPARRRLQALLVAMALGLGTGIAAQTCAGGDTVATD